MIWDRYGWAPLRKSSLRWTALRRLQPTGVESSFYNKLWKERPDNQCWKQFLQIKKRKQRKAKKLKRLMLVDVSSQVPTVKSKKKNNKNLGKILNAPYSVLAMNTKLYSFYHLLIYFFIWKFLACGLLLLLTLATIRFECDSAVDQYIFHYYALWWQYNALLS